MIDRRLAARVLMDIWPKAHVFVMPFLSPSLWTIDVAFYKKATSHAYEIRLGVHTSTKLFVGHNFVTDEVPDTHGRKCFLSGDGTSDLIGYMSYLRTLVIPDENDHQVLPDYDLKAPCINLYFHTAKLAESRWNVRNQTPNIITVKAEGESYEVTFYRPGEPLARIKSLSGLKPYLDTPAKIEKEALKARYGFRQTEIPGLPLTQVLDLSGDPDPDFLGLDPDRME